MGCAGRTRGASSAEQAVGSGAQVRVDAPSRQRIMGGTMIGQTDRRAGKAWRALLGDLHTWKRGGARAVHKPLLTLMLLARAQRGGGSEVGFAEIEPDLLRLLQEFGPPRKSHHPEYPFWYLQNDGYWVVKAADALPRRKGKDQPTKSALLAADAVGCVPSELWSQLLRERDIIPDLARLVLEEFWPATYHDDIAASLGLDMVTTSVSTRRDPAFRGAVLRAYERRCAMCGYDGRLDDMLIGLEAAHVKFKQEGGPDLVENGLALCSLHHKLFDRGALGIDTALRVRVSDRLAGHEMVRESILRFNGRPLTGPQPGSPPPAEQFIRWHEKYVFQGEARPA
jgi:putative restriction endonuclease